LLASAEEIGQVSTVFKFVGPNDRIVVEAFDDPKVDGVTCYLSRAKTGGVKGGLGPGRGSRRSVDCLPSGRADQLQG
jgi:CreA protein